MRPIRRRELIRKLRALGFEGPFSIGKHPFMQKEPIKVHIPIEHGRDISVALQREIISQAGINIEQWENA